MFSPDGRDNLDMIDKQAKLYLMRALITDVLQSMFTERTCCFNRETYLSSSVISDVDSMIKFLLDLHQVPFHFLSNSLSLDLVVLTLELLLQLRDLLLPLFISVQLLCQSFIDLLISVNQPIFSRIFFEMFFDSRSAVI